MGKKRRAKNACKKQELVITVNKSDMIGEIITELHNIQKTSIHDGLFDIPSDYREIPSLQMPGRTQ